MLPHIVVLECLSYRKNGLISYSNILPSTYQAHCGGGGGGGPQGRVVGVNSGIQRINQLYPGRCINLEKGKLSNYSAK